MLPKFLRDLDPMIYLSENYLVLDKETTNLDKGSALNKDNRHILSVWYNNLKGKYKLKIASEYELQELIEEIESVDFIVAHNAKFELQWLAREGLDLTKVLVFDTQIAEYVIQGNRKAPLGLEPTCKRHRLDGKDNFISTSIKSGVCPGTLPKSLLSKYCWKDVNITRELFLKQRAALLDARLLPVLFTRCIFTPVLADIETNGVHLDKKLVEEEYREQIARKQELEVELAIMTGGINTASTKQMAEFLYDELKFKELTKYNKPIRTDKGGRKTDASTIGNLKCRNKKQEKFKKVYLEWNSLKASLSKNLEYFYGVVTETEDHVFYFQFNQTITATHRLSSSGRSTKFKQFPKAKGIQGQNLPRKYKRLFNARREGWNVGERDGAQLEFRVAAHLGRDRQANEDIANGFDVHSNTARILTEAGQHTDRQMAKAHTFKPLFGGSSGSDAEQLYYAAFKERYYSIAAWQQGNIDTVLRDKQLRTESGLIFYWPDTYMTNSGYVTNSTSVCNYPVQSLATAEIIPVAVTYMWHKMKEAKLQAFLTNTIHDSVITEEPEEESEIINTIAKEAFTTDVYNYLQKVYGIDFTVPLDLDSKICNHWGSNI